jgi:nucleotide-binding universal stress UspA family protein
VDDPLPSGMVHGLVVGVDGSSGAEQALAWALREASLRKVPLQAVRVWSPSGDAVELERLAALRSVAELEEALGRDLEAAVAAVKDSMNLRAVPVATVVSYGHPVKALIDAAGQDNLLVTGSRGRGRLRGMLLGSVSQNCAQYARGPVVVVRGEFPRANPTGRIVVGVDGSAESIAGLPKSQRICNTGLSMWCMHDSTLCRATEVRCGRPRREPFVRRLKRRCATACAEASLGLRT